MNTFFLIFTLFLPPLSLSSAIDLEDLKQDFVLETKKIEIAGHPHAFNPSIIRWQGRLLMSFREMTPWPIINWFQEEKFINSVGSSQIGLIWLNDNFSPMGSPQILRLQEEFLSLPSRSEDARLIAIGDRLYLVYSDNQNPLLTDGGFRMYIAELLFDGIGFSLSNVECLSCFEGENAERREKNWVPFAYQDNLFLAYSLLPHRILRPIGEEVCETFSTTKGTIAWDWGELRGGSPGILDGDHYLAFFHSCMYMTTLHSHEECVLHYFMGAYTFSSQPPFEITQISFEPIIGKNFYKGREYEPYWKPVRVVFPCGFIFNQDYVWITYGRQDHEIWMAKLDKQKLLSSLIPIASIEE